MSKEQEKAIKDIRGLRDQIKKGHWLNVHFRAVELAYFAWKQYIEQGKISHDQRRDIK